MHEMSEIATFLQLPEKKQIYVLAFLIMDPKVSTDSEE